MRVTPVSPAALADELADLLAARPGRVRLVLDGPPPAAPGALAAQVADRLRVRGRAALVVDAADFLRPASVRLEFGHADADAFLDRWLDAAALRREVLEPAGPAGSGRVLPRLWNAAADRSFRDDYMTLPDEAVVLVHGALLLGRGLPADLRVHLRMSGSALARRLPGQQAWTLPAYARYDAEHAPGTEADLLVLCDHPARPAVVRG